MSNDKRWAFFYFLSAASVFFYVAYRAFNLSLTHDESLSYSIVWGNKEYAEDANNHLLNTALMTFLVKKYGDAEWLLRLPNVLSFIIYAFFSFKIIQKLPSNALKIGSYSLILLNPFILDFFSLARGYGISLGMMTASIYFLLKIADNYKSIFYNVAFAFFSIGAVYANFTLLIFYLAAMTIWGSIWLYHQKLKILISPIPLSILAFHGYNLYFLLKFLFFLKEKGKLYAGGKSLMEGIVESNITCLLYDENLLFKPLENTLIYIAIGIFFIAFVAALLKIFLSDFKVVLAILLAICLIIPFLQNHFLDILYPLERTATFYYVLWVLCLSFLSFKNEILQKVHLFGVTVLSVFVFVNFIKTANLHYSHSWKYDTNTKDMMQSLKYFKDNQQLSDSTKMTVYWLQYPASNVYYRPKYAYSWLTISQFDAEKIQKDDLFYLPEDIANALFFKENYHPLKHYPDTKTVLLKKK